MYHLAQVGHHKIKVTLHIIFDRRKHTSSSLHKSNFFLLSFVEVYCGYFVTLSTNGRIENQFIKNQLNHMHWIYRNKVFFFIYSQQVINVLNANYLATPDVFFYRTWATTILLIICIRCTQGMTLSKVVFLREGGRLFQLDITN